MITMLILSFQYFKSSLGNKSNKEGVERREDELETSYNWRSPKGHKISGFRMVKEKKRQQDQEGV